MQKVHITKETQSGLFFRIIKSKTILDNISSIRYTYYTNLVN